MGSGRAVEWHSSSHALGHRLYGSAQWGLVPASAVEEYVCYRYLKHLEAAIQNKNILKPVKNLVHKYSSSCAFQMMFGSVAALIPAGSDHHLQQDRSF